MATSKTTKSTAAKHFPATAGAPDIEVAERSADRSNSTRNAKEFAVLASVDHNPADTTTPRVIKGGA